MKNMTNTKAFWICFFAPVALILLWTMASDSIDRSGMSGSVIFLVSAPFLLVSFFAIFFIPAVLIGAKYGTEFRKYGFYGTLSGFLGLIFLGHILIPLLKSLF